MTTSSHPMPPETHPESTHRRLWEPRAGRPADVPAYVGLLRTNLGEGSAPRTEAYWQWKHEANPFGPSAVLTAAREDETVALRVFMRWRWRIHGAPVEAVRAVDTATAHAWRGQGIFRQLTLALVEAETAAGTAFVVNTPNENSRPGNLKMGWQTVGRPTVWVRPLRGLVRRGREPDLSRIPDAATVLERGDLDGFLDRVRADGQHIETDRSAAYLRWRYAGVPGLSYHSLADIEDGEGALVVLRGRRRGRWQEISLSELLVTPGARGQHAVARLLRRVARNAGGDYAVALAAARTPEWHALLHSGFIPAPNRGPYVVVRPLATSEPGLSALASWRFSIGDLELF